MSMVAVRPPKEFLSQMYHPDENNEERRLLKKLAQIIVENGQYEENASENDVEHELEEEAIYLDDDYPEDQGDQVQEQQQMQEPYYQQTEEPYTDYQVNNRIKIVFAKLDSSHAGENAKAADITLPWQNLANSRQVCCRGCVHFWFPCSTLTKINLIGG